MVSGEKGGGGGTIIFVCSIGLSLRLRSYLQ